MATTPMSTTSKATTMSTIQRLGVRVRSAAEALPLDAVAVAVQRLRAASDLLLAVRRQVDRPDAVPGVERAMEHVEQAGYALRVARERLATYLTSIGLGGAAPAPATSPRPHPAPSVAAAPPRARVSTPAPQPDWWAARIAVLTDGDVPQRRPDASWDADQLLRRVAEAVRGGDRGALRDMLTSAPAPIGVQLTARAREPLARLAADLLGHPPSAADLPRLARATESRVRSLLPGLPGHVLDTVLARTCRVAPDTHAAARPAHPADTPVASAVLTGVLLGLLGRSAEALAAEAEPHDPSAPPIPSVGVTRG
jgi:hypothetical protein